jgi:two-component system osmolarity sensor histidine kinase EnvZ
VSRGAARRPLSRHYLGWLLGLFLLVELITVLSVLGFVLFPMARRSADDLAGLMVLSAHTWAKLPPAQRAAFEDELAREHRIALRPGAAALPPPTRHAGFFLRFLRESLARREGSALPLGQAVNADGEPWLWTRVSSGAQPVDVGFAYARMQTQPLRALGVVLASGTVLVALAALWLARRIARPVAALEGAAERLARGAGPLRLAETGPLELAQLARHFNAMAQQVHAMVQDRTTLLAGLSHDLRTPLARMRLSLELLAMDPQPQRIAALEREIEGMNTQIGQLLDLARGLHAEGTRRLALAPWLHDRAALHAETAAACGSRLQVHCPPDLTLDVAPDALARALDNLIVNALRHAPGAIELVGVAGPRACRLEVRDRGPGVPAGRLQSLWKPFAQLQPQQTGASAGAGYGLGLAVVWQLAQAQRWTVSLHPRPGGGLVARLEVPQPPGAA